MQNTTGRWRFAFFDREPHALFGEDVKTRNTILIWSRNKSERSTVFESGPLQKWRGNDRSAMFQRIRHTEFDGDIYMGIPKFHGASQATALQVLGSRWNRLEQAVLSIERMNLEATSNADDRIIFVGPTAYNFLNVLLRPPSSALEEGATLSENPLYAIRCASVNDTFILFGILTSHFAYWWWHVHGDGFHVSRRFISEFPFGLDVLGAKEAEILRECGIKLWSAIKNNPVISKNRGRISIAYSPNGYADVRQRADEALASFAGLDTKFVDELQQFNALTVAADLRDYGYDNIKIKEHAYA